MVIKSAVMSQLTYGKNFQGKRHSEEACNCLPVCREPDIAWRSPIQILAKAAPLSF